MSSQDIRNIIRQGEGISVEFKQSFNRQVIETLVAFANSKGGNIIIGVSDNKSIVGVEITKETIQSWQNEIKTKTEPSLYPNIESYTIENRTIVCICIQEYPVKPVSFQGRYYKRKNNSNHLLSVSEINDIYLQSIQTSWDSYPYAGANLLSLDTDKISHFIDKVNQSGRFKLVGNPFECLRKLRFIKDDIPTNASMLLF